MDLLTRANSKGVRLSYVDENLYCNFNGANAVDDSLLSDLKQNKNELIEYFRGKENSPTSHDKADLPVNKVEIAGEYYYDISRTMLYWLDENIDTAYKQFDSLHGSVFCCHRIVGKIDLDNFKKAVSFVINRHESLRATFHNIRGTFMMKIEPPDSELYIPEYIDKSASPADQEPSVEELIRFSGHKFSFSKGPLIVMRLIQTAAEEYILCIKVNHVICDEWSLEILTRDLLVAYTAFKGNKQPALDKLTCQYKDCLAFINEFTRLNYANHRRHWEELYTGWPKDLLLPGVERKEVDIRRRPLKRIRFELSDTLVERLTLAATSNATSLFVILQTILKLFLFRKTGQRDIVMGTFIFGRDLNHALLDDQIGCYAKTTVVRTILSAEDNFSSAFKKVNKANDDLRKYSACSLFSYLGEIPRADGRKDLVPWTINVQFEDMNRSHMNGSEFMQAFGDSGLDIQRMEDPVVNSLATIDLQFVFVRNKEKLELVAQYDASLYDAPMINEFIAGYNEFAWTLFS